MFHTQAVGCKDPVLEPKEQAAIQSSWVRTEIPLGFYPGSPGLKARFAGFLGRFPWVPRQVCRVCTLVLEDFGWFWVGSAVVGCVFIERCSIQNGRKERPSLG